MTHEELASLTVKRLKEYGIHEKGEDLQMSRGRLGYNRFCRED